MKRTILFYVALSLLAVLTVSCGSNSLNTIVVTAPQTELVGEGGTLQLTATGNYSYGPTDNLTDKVTYTVTGDGNDINGNSLPAPPSNVTINSTGLLTAVDPFVCTFAPGNSTGTTVTSWVLTGSYKVVATYKGVTSQPFYVGMASAAGDPAAPANGQCGPTTN